MRVKAGCELVLEAAQETAVVSMLRPRRGQRVLEDRFLLSTPLAYTQFFDAFGNVGQRLVVPRGELRIHATTEVETDPDVLVNRFAPRVEGAKLPDSTLPFARASRYCPCDKLEKLATDITAASLGGYQQVQAICDYLHDTVEYRYGVSNVSTDALDTLAQRAGVCRDFSHAAIALCRAIGIPARMVAGYLHGLAPMDLHAWFEAYLGDRWYTFDASEDTLEGGRIVLAYGRDAADVAFLSSFGPLQLRSLRVWAEREAQEVLEPYALIAS
jgi:transglutaminase-like putative cysteine protease